MSIKILNSITPARGFDFIVDALKNVDPLDLSSRHVVLVPDRYTLSAEKMIYASLKGKGSLNINVIFLSRLLKQLNIKEKFISSFGAIMLIRRACKSVTLNYYSGSLKYSGFYSAIYECISGFISQCLTPEDVLKAADSASDQLKLRLLDIYNIYNAYNLLIEGKYLDSSGAAILISKYAHMSDYIKNSHFYIAGFDDPSKAELNCFSQIAKHSKNCIFSIGMGLDEQNRANSNLLEYFNSLLLPSKFITLPNNLSEQDRYIYYNLEKSNPAPFSGKINRNYLFISCGSELEEAEFCAQSILEHISSGGKLSEIAVISCDSEKIFPLIKTFKEYNIPFHLKQQGLLSQNIVFKTIIRLIKCVTDNLSCDDVLFCVKSGYLSIPIAETNIFENYCLKYGINRNGFLKPFELFDETDDLASAEFVRRAFENSYREVKAVEEDSFLAISKAIEIITSNNSFEDLSNTLFSENLFAQHSAHKQTVEKITELLKQLNEMTDSESYSLKEYTNYLITGAETITISSIPASADTVLCGDTESYRYLKDIKKMFILGAVEGMFPKSSVSSGILSKTDLKELPTLSQDNNNIDYIKLLMNRFKAKLLYLADVEDMFFTYTSINNVLSDYVANLKKLFNINIQSGLKYKLKRLDLEPLSATTTLTAPNEVFIRSGYSSVSALECYFNCPRQHFYRYGLYLKPRDKSEMQSLDRGSFLHLAIEYFVRHYQKNITTDILDLAQKSYEFALSDSRYSRYLNTSTDYAMFEKLRQEVIRTCNALALLAEKSAYITEKKYIEASFKNGGDLPPLSIDVADRTIKLGGKIDRIDFYESKNGEVFARVIDYKSGNSEYNDKELYFGNKIQLFIYMTVLKNCNYKTGGLYYFPVHDTYREENSYAYSLSGVTPIDDELMQATDSSIVDGYSYIAGFKLKKNQGSESFSETKNLLYPDTLSTYLAYSSAVCKQALSEILGGNICASPVKECSMCDYSNICGFETDNIVLREQSLGQQSRKYITNAMDPVPFVNAEKEECNNE